MRSVALARARLVQPGLVAVLEVPAADTVEQWRGRDQHGRGSALLGPSLPAGEPAQRDQARRLLDLLMDGLRYGAPAAR